MKKGWPNWVWEDHTISSIRRVSVKMNLQHSKRHGRRIPLSAHALSLVEVGCALLSGMEGARSVGTE